MGPLVPPVRREWSRADRSRHDARRAEEQLQQAGEPRDGSGGLAALELATLDRSPAIDVGASARRRQRRPGSFDDAHSEPADERRGDEVDLEARIERPVEERVAKDGIPEDRIPEDRIPEDRVTQELLVAALQHVGGARRPLIAHESGA
jgi:hypothetical protein